MIQSRKFSSICICAGSPSNDLRAARIMKSIKKAAPETTFFGVGGPLMEAEGLKPEHNYGDLKKLLDKPFFPYKNHLREHVERPWHPLLAELHYKNEKQIQTLMKNNFFKDLHVTKPEAFITVGNEFFARDLYCALNQFYEQHDQIKPPTLLVERFSHNQRSEFKTYLDHFLYTVPTKPVNWRYFTFPSTSVGQEGVYQAYRYLYEKNEYYKSYYLKPDSIQISAENHQEVIDALVSEQRSVFREKHGLTEDHQVFFLAPGNTPEETKKFMALFKESIETFLKQNGHDSANYAVVISLQNNEAIPEMPIRVIEARDQDSKFSGLCGADQGVAVNGEIVNEFAAFQLPTIVINDIGLFKAYFTLFDVNFTANGMVYPELMACKFGDAFPQKLADFFKEFQAVPKTRYLMARRLNQVVQDMVPKVESEKEQIVVDGHPINICVSPDALVAKRVLDSAKAFATVKQTAQRHEFEDEREKMLKQMAWN